MGRTVCPVRRVATGAAWAVLLLALTGTSLYVGLLTSRKVSPPIVPIDSSNRLPGYSTGDAVLVRDIETPDVVAGDVLAAHRRGGTVVGVVRRTRQVGSATEYRLVGARAGVVTVTDRDLIGRADRRVPLIGWLLLAARQRLLQLVAGALVVGFIVLLVLGRRTPLAFLEDPDDPFELAHQPLALPAGPRPRSMTAPPDMAYVEHPMSITPDDLRQVRFAQTRKGYDTEAVDRALDTVADSIENMLQERQQLIERLRVLESEVERFKGMESQLGQTLAMAEKSAEQVKADAQVEAQRILAEAQASGGVPGAASNDGAMVELLGEMRAIRSLLTATLAQGQPPAPPAPPQY
ncbi:MAG: putative Cell division protein DivIVA [Actinomycetia bacterium]|nr:putative Cell division protein DivIVA [Actinomycetes bacterium]